MKPDDELKHLLTGSSLHEKIEGIGLVQFNVHCPGNASEVICKCREVLEVVIRESLSNHYSDEDWEKILPNWFVERCAKQETEEETQQWLEWWRKLSPEEQIRVNSESEWSLSDWIAWFDPDERQWFWWDAVVENQNLLRLAVEVKAWPFSWGELNWLLRASGAANMSQLEENYNISLVE